MHTETWKPLPGSEGRYEVSDQGRVKSLLRGDRILKTARTGPRGYLMFSPIIDGRSKTTFVHHAVLFAFVGPRPAGMYACHNNDIADDNRLENLRWDTPQSNVADWIRARGWAANKNAKLTPADVIAIRSDPRSRRVMSEIYGITQLHVRDVRKGRFWKNVPFYTAD